MATTVNNAFKEFMCDKVNLDQERTKTVKRSKDNLIEKINSLECNEDFLIYTPIFIFHLDHLIERQRLGH